MSTTKRTTDGLGRIVRWPTRAEDFLTLVPRSRLQAENGWLIRRESAIDIVRAPLGHRSARNDNDDEIAKRLCSIRDSDRDRCALGARPGARPFGRRTILVLGCDHRSLLPAVLSI